MTVPLTRPRTLRIGLLLAAVLAVANAIPALDVGFDGSGMDVVVVVVAVLAALVLLGTLVLGVPAWRGNRRAALVVAVLALVAILPSLPAFALVATGEIPAVAAVAAGVGLLLQVLAAVLILRGR
jgi:hypothetical protein